MIAALRLGALFALGLIVGCGGGGGTTGPQGAPGGAAPTSRHLEVEGGALNTNFTRGSGFTPATGVDADPAPAVRQRPDGMVEPVTDARVRSFPNQRTDVLAIGEDDPHLAAALDLARKACGADVGWRFLRPDAAVVNRLGEGVRLVQAVVNQPFVHDGHDLLVTWILPPGWDPARAQVPLVVIPGFGHTNNTKLFGDDQSFLSTWLSAVSGSASGDVVLVCVNCGGRTSMGLHPGWIDALDDALRWGAANLGLDLSRLVFNGGSRGGYGALTFAGMLAGRPGMNVRGIFATVFGTVGAETTVSFESVPQDLGIWGGREGYARWRDLLFVRDAMHSDLLQRVLGVSTAAEAEANGPLGAARRLAAIAGAGSPPIACHLAWGSRDNTMLPSSAWRLIAALRDRPGIALDATMHLGAGHEAGNAERNLVAARCAARLADGRMPDLPRRLRWIAADGTIHADPAPPLVIVRLPVRSAVGRVVHIDCVGPAGARLRLDLDEAATAVGTREITLDAEGCAAVTWTMPARAGRLIMRVQVDGQALGSDAIEVEATVPTTYDLFRTRWLTGRMPAIEGWPPPPTAGG